MPACRHPPRHLDALIMKSNTDTSKLLLVNFGGFVLFTRGYPSRPDLCRRIQAKSLVLNRPFYSPELLLL
jgi:hypothetical protein